MSKSWLKLCSVSHRSEPRIESYKLEPWAYAIYENSSLTQWISSEFRKNRYESEFRLG
jgi:hypothetical protein